MLLHVLLLYLFLDVDIDKILDEIKHSHAKRPLLTRDTLAMNDIRFAVFIVSCGMV